MSDVHVFVSFDTEHDRDLYEQLLAQSKAPGSGFEVIGATERATAADPSGERSRRHIREADQMIVICGEHTDASMRVSAEIDIAQQESTPYFLLNGRRETMCTKPVGSKSAEGMYSWTRQILMDQISLTTRTSAADLAARLGVRKS
jgi:hypothetical protein